MSLGRQSEAGAFDCCFTCFCWKPGCGDGYFSAATLQHPVTHFVGMERQLQRWYPCLPKILISAPQIAITPSSSTDMLCCGCGKGVFPLISPSGGLLGRLLHAQPTASSANPCNSSVSTQIFISNAFPLKIAGLVPVSRCKYLLYDKYL